MPEPATPLMRQYHALKQQVPNALLFFRLGDFYELFYEDAVTASRELEITLTSRNKERGEPIPMCGVPYHAVDGHLARLIQKGYRIAICEQVEDPKQAKKLVKREVTRIVTPGTTTETNLLQSRQNNYLGGLVRKGESAGLAWVDVSTGEFRTAEASAADVVASIETLDIKEVVVAEGSEPLGRLTTELEDWIFSYDYAERIVREQFGLLSLDGCGLAERPLAVAAAGAVLHYLRDTQRSALGHLERPVFQDRREAMEIDSVTVRNLELVDPLFAGEGREVTLLHVLDRTETGMGGRLLRRRLLGPALDRGEIEARLDALEELTGGAILRGEVRKTLSGVMDLERLLAKVTLGSANPREMLALAKSLQQVPELKRRLVECRSPRLVGVRDRMDEIPELRDELLGALADAPPVNLADGGVIRDGFHAELDELRGLRKNSRSYIVRIEVRERERTGIQSLKVKFNNVFGYFIEVSKANLHLVPDDYDRKQTLVNAERFITPELKELEAKILDAEEKILFIERELFAGLRTRTASEASRIRQTAGAVAELDVVAALAQVAAENRYTRPRFSDGGLLEIAGGRHPVIEKLQEREAERFIPNDLHLDPGGEFLAIITGPNMGGKSTYLRQCALIAIMAQAGSFVPADSASLPLTDRVFTRIGAADNLARGRSTFMVEMTETAVILNTATADSLIILDEIGRGTATYDGLALAWAVVEHIHEKIRARTLFATHYHELTELAEQLPGVRNFHVSVKEAGEKIIFLRKVEPGQADRSYGIEVARLAALPVSVIERAREILSLHEKSEHEMTEELAPQQRPSAGMQIQLFEPVNYQIAERIRKLSLDELKPIEALQLLAKLQEELNRE